MARTYIIKRNDRYHFRIRVPKGIRHAIGLGEIRRSLHTSDIRVARKLARGIKAKVESEFAQLRHQQLLSFEIVLPRNGNVMSENAAPGQGRSRSALTAHDLKPSPTVGQLIHEFVQDREKVWALRTKQTYLVSLERKRPVFPTLMSSCWACESWSDCGR